MSLFLDAKMGPQNFGAFLFLFIQNGQNGCLVIPTRKPTFVRFQQKQTVEHLEGLVIGLEAKVLPMAMSFPKSLVH